MMADSTIMRGPPAPLKPLPGIFGSPQPSQVRRGSMPARTPASPFIKITPAFAYDPYNGKTRAQRTTSRRKARRLESAERAEYALKRIRNRKPTNAVRSRLS